MGLDESGHDQSMVPALDSHDLGAAGNARIYQCLCTNLIMNEKVETVTPFGSRTVRLTNSTDLISGIYCHSLSTDVSLNGCSYLRPRWCESESGLECSRVILPDTASLL